MHRPVPMRRLRQRSGRFWIQESGTTTCMQHIQRCRQCGYTGCQPHSAVYRLSEVPEPPLCLLAPPRHAVVTAQWRVHIAPSVVHKCESNMYCGSRGMPYTLVYASDPICITLAVLYSCSDCTALIQHHHIRITPHPAWQYVGDADPGEEG